MTLRDKTTIAILGAGIAGLFSAIALHRKGFKVTLYERNSKPRDIGAGLVLWPNATYILDKLELLNDIKSIAYSLDKMQRFTESGEFLNEINLKNLELKTGHTNYAVTRKSLQTILINNLQAANIKLNFDYQVTKIKLQSDNKAVVHFQNNKIINADIIIGADGRMNSISRKYVTGNNQPIYQGYVNWVGLFRGNSDFNFEKHIMDYWGCGERFGIVPLSKHSAYWAGCKALPEGLGTPEIGNKKRLLAIFKHWPDNILSLIEHCRDEDIKRIEVYDHNPITRWHQDNVCLIGDAAHAALPTSGQGACQAIEDAYYLAECLSSQGSHLKTRNQLAFEQFYKLRSKTTANIIENARDFARSLFNTDPKFCATRNRKARQQQ